MSRWFKAYELAFGYKHVFINLDNVHYIGLLEDGRAEVWIQGAETSIVLSALDSRRLISNIEPVINSTL